jgi:hypothetical protein
MGVLDKLTVTTSEDRTKGYDPVRVRRRKLADALQNQLNLLQAHMAGQNYRKASVKRKRDLESDEVYEVEQQRRVAPWWWIDDAGAVRFTIHYGSVKLPLKDGKDVIVLQDFAGLAKLLPALRQEVLTGVLDEALAAAAASLQQRFKSNDSANT